MIPLSTEYAIREGQQWEDGKHELLATHYHHDNLPTHSELCRYLWRCVVVTGKPMVRITIEKESTRTGFDVPAKFGTNLIDILRKDAALRQAVNDGLYHGYTITMRHYIASEDKV